MSSTIYRILKYSLLDCVPFKYYWKRVVHKAVNTYWVDILKQRASLYSSLVFLCVDSYWPGKKHPLIQNVGCVSDVPRVHTKLKLVTGVYVLQVNRACFNQNSIDATCQLCHQADGTVAHFLLDCPVLESVRRPVLEAICNIVHTVPLNVIICFSLFWIAAGLLVLLEPPLTKPHTETSICRRGACVISSILNVIRDFPLSLNELENKL